MATTFAAMLCLPEMQQQRRKRLFLPSVLRMLPARDTFIQP
ncbi:hypothetical protein [Hymenobacter glaciei]